MLALMRRDEFELIVDEALESLPDWVVDRVENLHVVVEEWPSRDQDPDGSGLLGIYEGISLLDRGVDYSGFLPDRIVVFMGPHLRLRLDRPALITEIRTTVLHEIAHHLGIDDERLHELGWD
jgi:predicted Zn-dependent protease with MMP-like domain